MMRNTSFLIFIAKFICVLVIVNGVTWSAMGEVPKGGTESALSTEPLKPLVFSEGAKCLFIGHSFFIPVAKSFDKFARANDYTSHKAEFVFAGGKGGSPGSLWNSVFHGPKARKILAEGDIDLLGMTYFNESNSSLQDYCRWIDLALTHNPKIRIFIGLCWIPRGPKLNTKVFESGIQMIHAMQVKKIEQLRKTFPQVHFYYVNYGKVAVEMKARHQAGDFPEIKTLVGKDRSALFRDPFGHAGPLLLDLAAMTWMDHLYGADIQKLKGQAAKSSGVPIAMKVAAYNKQYTARMTAATKKATATE